jgi:AraC-like DNA-binding protein
MLVQSFLREVPEHGAYIARTILRDTRLCVAVVRTQGLVLDRGVIGKAIQFPTRFQRPQLTIVLRGRGYLESRDRGVVTLRPGDVAESHQRDHVAEGYSGSPGEAILVDWEGSVPVTSPRLSRISPGDVSGLSAHVASLSTLPPVGWIAKLSLRLRALGLEPSIIDPDSLAPPPAPMVRLYAALGGALSRLDAQPSLPELAEALGSNERQVHRQLAQLARTYGHSFASWRDFLHEMRLDWATQLLSIPEMPLGRVAKLAGYRSTTALHHAYSLRGAETPMTIANRLRERWV